MNRTHNPSLGASQQSRLLALTLSAVFTLSMLLGVNALAQHDSPAPLLAQAVSAKA